MQTDVVVSGYPGLDPLCLSVTLVGVQTSRVQLVIRVLGDPDVVIPKFGTLQWKRVVFRDDTAVLGSRNLYLLDKR